MFKRAILLLLMGCFVSALHAGGRKEPLTTPTFRDDGTLRVPFGVKLSSTSAVNPIAGIFFGNDTDGQWKRIRHVFLENTSSSYTVRIGTWSGITGVANNDYWIVQLSTVVGGTWDTYNAATFYISADIIVGQSPSSPTVRGFVEMDPAR